MSEKEKAYKKALDNAVASVEMEGYNVSAEEKGICFEFLNGKLNKEEFIKTILERCRV